MARKPVSLLVTDLDNTLFDWFDIWYSSFTAMLNAISATSGLTAEVLEPEFKKLHQTYGTAEYAFSIEELPSLKARHPGEDLRVVYKGAIDAFRVARAEKLRLYPQVMETLQAIRGTGCLVVGYTESKEYYSHFRMNALGLDVVFDYLYTPPDHPLPGERKPAPLQLRKTVPRHTPEGEVKPNPDILLDIISKVGGTIDSTIYVGDSLMKDIKMAQDAGVTDVYAKYGVAVGSENYALLQRVTHWPDAVVKYEDEQRKGNIPKPTPTYTLDKSFGQLLELFSFEAAPKNGHAGGS